MRALIWMTAATVLASMSAGCGERQRPCGLDQTCPMNTHCVDGFCRNAPWWADVKGGGDGACLSGAQAKAPAGRSAAVGGWVSGAFEIYGGNPSGGGLCQKPGTSAFTAHRWRTCGGWQAHAGPVPTPRADAASATGFGSVWSFGGRRRDGGGGPWALQGDPWRLSGSPARWTLASTSDAPVRHSAAIAVQESPPSVWVFGGDASSNDAPALYLPDIRRYRLDQSEWDLPVVTGARPAARAEHGLVALNGGAKLVLFGGAAQDGLRGDTWVFDTKTMQWQARTDAGPSPRRSFAMAADQDTVWLFGGIDDSPQVIRNDLWRFQLATGWERLRAGDLGAEALVGGVVEQASSICAPPSKWVNLDLESPPRRSHAISDVHDGGLWVYGGRGSCGPLGDLWRLDFESLQWTVEGTDDTHYPCPRDNTGCSAWCESP